MTERNAKQATNLPAPVLSGEMSLEESVSRRRCVREFRGEPLTTEQVSQLCWAGQGITDQEEGLRSVPSAGALYPIELYVVTSNCVDHYDPVDHRLRRHLGGDVRPALQRASLDQEMICQAPVCVVIAALVKRMARKYGARAERYCFIEAGHVAQNILLQATAMQLAGVPIGAYEDDEVAAVLRLPTSQRVLYLLAIGIPSG